MDALRLNYNAKDQLHPLLSDVITAVNKVTKEDFEGRGKIVQWLITLNQMGAGDEIDEGQRRQVGKGEEWGIGRGRELMRGGGRCCLISRMRIMSFIRIWDKEGRFAVMFGIGSS